MACSCGPPRPSAGTGRGSATRLCAMRPCVRADGEACRTRCRSPSRTQVVRESRAHPPANLLVSARARGHLAFVGVRAVTETPLDGLRQPQVQGMAIDGARPSGWEAPRALFPLESHSRPASASTSVSTVSCRRSRCLHPANAFTAPGHLARHCTPPLGHGSAGSAFQVRLPPAPGPGAALAQQPGLLPACVTEHPSCWPAGSPAHQGFSDLHQPTWHFWCVHVSCARQLCRSTQRAGGSGRFVKEMCFGG